MRVLILFILISFVGFSQKENHRDSIKSYIKNGLILTSSSFLPYSVAYKTSISPIPINQKKIYVTAWVGFAVYLDINAIYYFRKAHKLKKALNSQL